ncbi:hypothetical protein [Methylobacterium sp. CCH5-D2]|uniref:hypothetical protein n=1 Tax=Methylobacterium sp. CCH5-D2 TaxID=1768765 RepID=UPI000829A202|nr:hypothetical protein [Methylobacterium sp. CCH5-D2]
MHGPSFALGRWRKERGLTAHVPLADTVCRESYADGYAAGETRVQGGRGGRFAPRVKPGRR